MITFDPLWEQLKKRGINKYQLLENYDFNPVEVYRLKHNHNYTLSSIDRFCKILSCEPDEIIAFVDDSETDKYDLYEYTVKK